MKNIIIAGGGVAGFGAAITLGSSSSQKLQTLVIDSGNSDILKAKLYNVPFIKQGTCGEEVLKRLKEDALAFKSVSFENDTVISIDGVYPNFILKTKEKTYKTNFIILATGCHELNIKLNGEFISTSPHLLMPRLGKIRINFKGRQELQEGIYVAGLISGITTMYATALGSGVEAACAILSKIEEKISIVHDFEGSRTL